MLTRKQSWRRVKPPNPRFHESSDCTETDGYSKNGYSQLQFKTHNLVPKEIVLREQPVLVNPVQLVSNPFVPLPELPMIVKPEQKPAKSISFCPTVRVCLVPSRNCLSSFADELFWAPDDYKNFKSEAMYEIRAALDARNKSGYKNWSHRDVRDYLYQPTYQPVQGLSPSSSNNLNTQVEKAGSTYPNRHQEEELFKERDIADVSWYQQAVTDMQDIVAKAWDPKRHKQQQDQQQLHPSMSAMRRVDSVQLFKQNALAGLAADEKDSTEEDVDPYKQAPPIISDPDPSLNRMMRRVDSVQLFKKYANSFNQPQPQRIEPKEPSEPQSSEDFAGLDFEDDINNNNNNISSSNDTRTGSSKSSKSDTVPTNRSSGNNNNNNNSGGGSGSNGSYSRSNSGSFNGGSNFSNSSSSSGSNSGSSSSSSSGGGGSGNNTSNNNGSTNYCNNCSTITPTNNNIIINNNNNNNNHRSINSSEEDRGDSRVGNRLLGKLELSVIPVVLPV